MNKLTVMALTAVALAAHAADVHFTFDGRVPSLKGQEVTVKARLFESNGTLDATQCETDAVRAHVDTNGYLCATVTWSDAKWREFKNAHGSVPDPVELTWYLNGERFAGGQKLYSLPTALAAVEVETLDVSGELVLEGAATVEENLEIGELQVGNLQISRSDQATAALRFIPTGGVFTVENARIELSAASGKATPCLGPWTKVTSVTVGGETIPDEVDGFKTVEYTASKYCILTIDLEGRFGEETQIYKEKTSIVDQRWWYPVAMFGVQIWNANNQEIDIFKSTFIASKNMMKYLIANKDSANARDYGLMRAWMNLADFDGKDRSELQQSRLTIPMSPGERCRVNLGLLTVMPPSGVPPAAQLEEWGSSQSKNAKMEGSFTTATLGIHALIVQEAK